MSAMDFCAVSLEHRLKFFMKLLLFGERIAVKGVCVTGYSGGNAVQG